MWISKIIVNYKPGILDPEAKTIQHAFDSLGYKDINDLTTGKYFHLTFGKEVNKERAEELTKEVSDKLLSNPVIENYTFETKEAVE